MEKSPDLLQEIHHLNQVLTRLEKHQRLPHSFIAGILYGLGSVLGATIVVALIAYLLRNVGLVPLIGNWFAQIVEHVITTITPKL